MSRELETVVWTIHHWPFTVTGTPFALDLAPRMNATKWVMRNGRKDEELTTELHKRFGDRPRMDQDHTLQRDIAAWLRAVHAKEERAKNVLEIGIESGRLWQGLNPYQDSVAPLRQFVGNMPLGTSVKVTIERLKP